MRGQTLQLFERYLTDMIAYDDLCAASFNQLHSRLVDLPGFPEFCEWLGCKDGVPGGDVFADAYLAAHKAARSAGAVSRHEYFTRFLQSVKTEISSSNDHTHDTAKNFGPEKDMAPIGKVFNIVTECSAIALMICTEGGKKSETIHAIEDLAHRQGWKPKDNISDIWPGNKEMWEWLWEWCAGRLDTFHWVKRVFETLNALHPDNLKARQEYSACVFNYKQKGKNSIEQVDAALSDGILNGTVHSPAMIAELKETGIYMNRYRKYIDAPTFSAEEIRTNLVEWISKWKDVTDRHKGKLFTRATMDKVNYEMKHIEDIVDLQNNQQTLLPKPNQKHPLTQIRRGRGSVETYHAVQGNMATPINSCTELMH